MDAKVARREHPEFNFSQPTLIDTQITGREYLRRQDRESLLGRFERYITQIAQQFDDIVLLRGLQILISVLFNTGTHQTENATSISQGRSCHKPGSADKDRSEDGSGSENDEEDVADYAYNDEDESQDDGDYESGDEDDGIKNKDCGDNGNDDIDRDGVETYTDEKELPNRINSDPRRRFGGTLLEKSTDYETYRERHDGIGSRRLASFLVPLAKFYAYGENGGAHKPPPEDFYKFAELRERAVAFQLIQAVKAKYGIADDDIYNFDETGFAMGMISTTTVVTGAETRDKAKLAQPGNREWATAIQGICVGETSLPKDWVIVLSDNGWTTNELALEWLKYFDKNTARRCFSDYRLLVLGGHESYHLAAFELYCQEHKIVTICMPPYSSHILQPLDAGCFGPLKQAYSCEVEDLVRTHITHISKLEFLSGFCKGPLKARYPVTSAYLGEFTP
ncbi:hypothetical protein Dda_6917 [Drechslerella dactyloides]|uniref:DDE-1 domain-containing protein n=1 Tax=Drechslerella dactyloides TaxID=74499 RepID=A0AAD6ISU2_DREDA|nr:hypothetical protein Dda_6917 [Drechslerella dactyloides]